MRLWVAGALLFLGCGTRSPLDVEQRAMPPREDDAGRRPPRPDAGRDAGPPDAGPPDSGPPDAGWDSGPPDAGPPPCVPERAALPAGAVDVVFVFDRSSSMGWTIPGTDTRPWEVLVAAMNDVFADLDPRIGAGALFFPSGARCRLGDVLDVPVAEDHMAAVLALLEGGVIDGRTPFDGALTLAYEALEAERRHRANRFVVYVTDGGMGCRSDDPTETYITPEDAHADFGIDTFGVLIEGLPGPPHRTAGRYRIAVNDYASLRSVLESIEAELSGCVFDVPFEPSHRSRVEVRVGGIVVPRGIDGWGWSGIDEASISLYGEACKQRLDSLATVEAAVVCDPDAG